ncbi:MAG: hypothetical protein IK020_11630 [Clostridiales bacterium]|nr:hypothetical protein [Clostridiales bacterium]
MAKQTRLATTLTARYYPTAELTDAFYMDGRITSKTVARSADLTNDKEERGFFFSVFSTPSFPDTDPNALPPYEPILRRLGTELKTGRRSLDDSIGEMVNTAVSITGKMKIQQDNSRAPFFAGVMVKDGEAFASTIGKGLAFLYRDDTLYPMTATDIRIDAINTARQKVDNFYNFCATKTAPALCSNIAQLKLDDCIILCNREVYEALGQQELLRILYDAEDQSDAASVVITEAAAKLPGVPLQFMISFVEDITSSDRGGFFGFGRKKKKVVEEDEDDAYNVAPPIPMDSPKKEEAPVPQDAMLFGDEAPKAEPRPSLDATMIQPPVGSAAEAIASFGAETAAAASAASAQNAATASTVEAAIKAEVPEPPLSFGDISELMNTDAKENNAVSAAPAAVPAVPVTPAVPSVPEAAAAAEEDLGQTKVLPYVSSFDKAAAELDAKIAGAEASQEVSPVAAEAPQSPFVAPSQEAVPAAPKKDEPFVAVKNADNPFAKAAQLAQSQAEQSGSAPAVPEAREIVPKSAAPAADGTDDGSFVVGGADAVNEGAPLFIGDEVFGGAASAVSAANKIVEGAEQTSEQAPSGVTSGSVAETDEDAPIVFEAEKEVDKPMNDDPEYSNDPKEFDETPLFFGDAESSEEKDDSQGAYAGVDSADPSGAAQDAPSGDEFVIPFASAEAPNTSVASANDVPDMPLYEAPSYVPPTYPTNSDTPVGYEDTGVYARGSYSVDEDEVTPDASRFVAPAAEPVSPFVTPGAYEEPAAEVPQVPGTDAGSYGDSPFVAGAYQETGAYEAPAQAGDYATPDYAAPADVSGAQDAYDPYAGAEPSQAAPQYDMNNPPPSVADLFDLGGTASAGAEVAASSGVQEVQPAPSYAPPTGVRPGSVPGVPKRPQQGGRPGARPNTNPSRRRPDTIDDGFDNEGEGMSYLPYVLAVVSVICLIIIIVLIVKSCSAGDDDASDTKATGDVSITDISGLIPGSSDPTTESTTEPEVTEPDVDAPIGVYTFSDKSGCRTWWDLFYHVYGVKIDGEKDPYVTTILTYNDLDSSYKPKSGDQIKLPPMTMFPPKGG